MGLICPCSLPPNLDVGHISSELGLGSALNQTKHRRARFAPMRFCAQYDENRETSIYARMALCMDTQFYTLFGVSLRACRNSKKLAIRESCFISGTNATIRQTMYFETQAYCQSSDSTSVSLTNMKSFLTVAN